MSIRFALFAFTMIAVLALSACGPAVDTRVQVVEDYLNALVSKDADSLSVLSCSEWEPNALLELDSLQAVDTRLEGLACELIGTEGDVSLVSCQGTIVATYNDEDQELDLSVRTYQVVEQGGSSLVCGYR